MYPPNLTSTVCLGLSNSQGFPQRSHLSAFSLISKACVLDMVSVDSFISEDFVLPIMFSQCVIGRDSPSAVLNVPHTSGVQRVANNELIHLNRML